MSNYEYEYTSARTTPPRPSGVDFYFNQLTSIITDKTDKGVLRYEALQSQRD